MGTCITDAPQLRNCKAISAESIPPIPRIGNPGRALAMDDIAFNAIGRVIFPETPPYVVYFSLPTAGQGVPFALTLISP